MIAMRVRRISLRLTLPALLAAFGSPSARGQVCSVIRCPNGGSAQCPNSHPTQEQMNKACGISDSSSSTASTSGEQMGDAAYKLGEALGKALNKWLFSPKATKTDAPGVDPNIEIEKERARVQQELERQMERQQRWRQEMEKLSRAWKGTGPVNTTLTWKDTSTNSFGRGTGGQTLEYKPTVHTPSARSFSDPAEQLRVSNCLFKMAAEPGRSADDAQYLSEEAAKALRGEQVDVATGECAGVQVPKTIGGEQGSVPLTADQVTLYTRLFELSNRKAEQIVVLEKHIAGLTEAEKKAKQDVELRRKAVEQLKEQPVSADDSQASDKKSSALAEAEAALRESQQAEADAEKSLGEANDQAKALQSEIQRQQGCFDAAQKDPSKAGELVKTCGN